MSVAAVLADTAAQRPDHSAVISESEHFTYEWLWEQARRYAAVLRANGVRPGDRVALLLVDTLRFPVTYFGVLAAGAVVIPLNAMSTASEIEHVLTDADARFLVCGTALLAQAKDAVESHGAVLLTV
ncbi:MAG: AMP-binding protein, partial [Vicinamibacterales bacterium]